MGSKRSTRRASMGAGIKVAVIDIGFVGAKAAMDSGDLPAGTQIINRCGESKSSHGTAVAELVHDMAPSAQLVLYCIDSELTLQIALDYVINQHIPIISHSITWLAGGRGDGVHNRPDAVNPDDIAKNAYDHGILWINAAGNYAQSHWSGPYSHRPGSVFEDFGGGDQGNTFTIPGSTTGCAALTWDAWPETDQNFNLYVSADGDRKRSWPGRRRSSGPSIWRRRSSRPVTRTRARRRYPSTPRSRRSRPRSRAVSTSSSRRGRSSTACRRGASPSPPSRRMCSPSAPCAGWAAPPSVRTARRGRRSTAGSSPTSPPTTASRPRRSGCRATATVGSLGPPPRRPRSPARPRSSSSSSRG